MTAFIDVLETLYVAVYKISSFPWLFLHLYFEVWVFSASGESFFIESEPFVKSVACSEPSPCHGVMEHSWDPQVPPKNSMVDSVASGSPVTHLSSDPNRPWPHKFTLVLGSHGFLNEPQVLVLLSPTPPLVGVFPKYQLKISTENTAWIHWHL